jgi:hypothetical protein
MALIRCPECQYEVSDHAPSCPQCGYPLAASAPRAGAPQVVHVKHDEQSGFSKGLEKGFEKVGTETAKGCVGLLIAALVIGVLVMAALIYNSGKCPACAGSGKKMLIFDCGECGGTGRRK